MTSRKHWLAYSSVLLLGLLASVAYGAPMITEATIYTRSGERALMLETAHTPELRAQGLMHRQQLKPNDGMIFLFPTAGTHSFWMKNTPKPLDMIFIDAENNIAHIEADVPANTLTPRTPPKPIQVVIELDGGRAVRDGIAVGDKVRYAVPAGLRIE